METKKGKQYCYAVKLKCFTYNKSAYSTLQYMLLNVQKESNFRIN